MNMPRRGRNQSSPATANTKSFENRLFLRNVDATTDIHQLKSILSNYGQIRRCELARDSVTGSYLGYGFVEFLSPLDAQRALRFVDTINIGEDQVYVERFVPKAEREANKPFNNLFVKNFLGDIVSDNDLERIFTHFGEIVSVKVQTNDEGHPVGHGFVCFRRPEEAKHAIEEMNGKLLPSGKFLHVSKFIPKDERRRKLTHDGQSVGGDRHFFNSNRNSHRYQGEQYPIGSNRFGGSTNFIYTPSSHVNAIPLLPRRFPRHPSPMISQYIPPLVSTQRPRRVTENVARSNESNGGTSRMRRAASCTVTSVTEAAIADSSRTDESCCIS